MGEGEGRSWLRCGCLGCLGVLGLLLLISLGLLAFGWISAGSAESVDRNLEQRLPAAPVDGAAAPPGSTEDAGAEISADALRGVGRIELEVSGTEFRVRPAPAGTPMRVEGRFDENAARLEESFEEAEDGSWVYRVRFEKTESTLVSAIKSLFGAPASRLEVHIPADVRAELLLDVARGGVDAELGGLDLRALDIRLHQGGGAFDISEPMPHPLERLTADVGMGGFALDGIGNASPKVVDIEFTMGGAGIDFSGAWRNDSDITVRNGGMGGGGVRIPSSGVRVEGVPGGGFTVDPAPGEIPLPVLRFSDRTTWDQLEIQR